MRSVDSWILGVSLVTMAALACVARAQDKVIEISAKFPVEHRLVLEKKFDDPTQLKSLGEALGNRLSVDAFQKCHQAFSEYSFIKFDALKQGVFRDESGALVAAGQFECSLHMTEAEVKYFLPGLLDGLADGNRTVRAIAGRSLKSAFNQNPSWEKEVLTYSAELSNAVRERLADIGLGGVSPEKSNSQGKWVRVVLKTKQRIGQPEGWGEEALKVVRGYLHSSAVQELADRCSSISGERGKILENQVPGKFVSFKGEGADFLDYEVSRTCVLNVPITELQKTLRTLYSPQRYSDWDWKMRMAILRRSGLALDEAFYWENELKPSLPLSSGSRAGVFQLAMVAPLGSARSVVLDSLLEYLKPGVNEPEELSELIRSWADVSADWLLEKVRNTKSVSGAKAAGYLATWGKIPVPMELLREVAKDKAAIEGVIAILENRIFDGQEASLFPLVLAAVDRAIKSEDQNTSSVHVIGKFRNVASLPSLNRALLVGGVTLSFHSRPDFVEAALESIEPLIRRPEAAKHLTNLKKIADSYFDPHVRAHAKELFALMNP